MITKAYRSYLIRCNLAGNWWIEKDQCLIQWAKTFDDAKRVIDALLGDSNKRHQ